MATLLSEDLWEQVLLYARLPQICALARTSRAASAAEQRDSLWKAYAASSAPRLWRALDAAPPGRDRFRRAVLLQNDGAAEPNLGPLTCCVIVSDDNDAVVYKARFPFAPEFEEAGENYMEVWARLACTNGEDQDGFSPETNYTAVTPEISLPFPAVTKDEETSREYPLSHPNLRATVLVERTDGRIAKLTEMRFQKRFCCSGSSDPGYLCVSLSETAYADWRFKIAMDLTFPRSMPFVARAPTEGRVFAVAINARPTSIPHQNLEVQENLQVHLLERFVGCLPWR